MYKERTHLKANSMADDATMTPGQKRKTRPKSALFPQFSTPRRFSLFFLQPSFPLRFPPFLQERELPFILIGVHMTTMKGIICPRPSLHQVLCPPVKLSEGESVFLWQLHPGRVWKMLIGVTSCEAACACMSSPCSFCSLSKI